MPSAMTESSPAPNAQPEPGPELANTSQQQPGSQGFNNDDGFDLLENFVLGEEGEEADGCPLVPSFDDRDIDSFVRSMHVEPTPYQHLLADSAPFAIVPVKVFSDFGVKESPPSMIPLPLPLSLPSPTPPPCPSDFDVLSMDIPIIVPSAPSVSNSDVSSHALSLGCPPSLSPLPGLPSSKGVFFGARPKRVHHENLLLPPESPPHHSSVRTVTPTQPTAQQQQQAPTRSSRRLRTSAKKSYIYDGDEDEDVEDADDGSVSSEEGDDEDEDTMFFQPPGSPKKHLAASRKTKSPSKLPTKAKSKKRPRPMRKRPVTSDAVTKEDSDGPSSASASGGIRRSHPMFQVSVLMGRGGCSNHHGGNETYRLYVQQQQAKYKSLSRQAKTEFSQTIVDWVRKRGGQFLKRAEGTELWFPVPDRVARQKVSQALREAHPPEGDEADGMASTVSFH